MRRFVFRHFQSIEVHPHAIDAALAAEAAGYQNEFWTMHDILLENQKDLEKQDLWRYAEIMRLDMSKFKNDFFDKRTLEKVNADYEGGVQSGVNRTPTFYINEEKVLGDDLLSAVSDHLTNLQKMRKRA